MPYIIVLFAEIFLLYLLMRRVSSKIFNLLYRMTRSKKIAVYFFAILFLPGTFIHEISHFLVALFLLVPVGQIELMPVIEEGGVKMGSVAIGKTDFLRRTLVGISPIIFGLTIIFGGVFWVYRNNLFHIPLVLVILTYLIFEVGNTMFSSKKDLEGSLITAILIVIIYVILYFTGVRINLDINQDLPKIADIFLLVPIGIDFLILFVDKLQIVKG